MRKIRAKATFLAWRKRHRMHQAWYWRIHDYEIRRNGECGAGACTKCHRTFSRDAMTDYHAILKSNPTYTDLARALTEAADEVARLRRAVDMFKRGQELASEARQNAFREVYEELADMDASERDVHILRSLALFGQ